MKRCIYSEYCGGCNYQDIDYQTQLQYKQKTVNDLLSDFGKVEDIIGMKDPDNYRNKVQFSFGYDEHRNVICGYYLPDSHQIIDVKECMIADEGINRIISSIKRIVKSLNISIYDERADKGCLRHVLIRMSSLGEYMVVLVTATNSLFNEEQLVKEIIRFNPEVKTIIHNINPLKTSIILGKKSIVLYGKGYITDELSGLKFRISPSSFYQVNKRQTEVLYETAIKAADLKEKDVLVDAYCGTGTIGLCAAEHVKKVIGIELNEEAVKDANINKNINEIKNAEFICGDAGQYMNQLAKTKRKIDCVIMDPPRSGSDQKFMSSMVRMAPQKIVYISCNPVTLKRDLNYLKAFYQIKRIIPVDMFPNTKHIESIVLLKR